MKKSAILFLILCCSAQLNAIRLRRGARRYHLHGAFSRAERALILHTGERATIQLSIHLPALRRAPLRLRFYPGKTAGGSTDLFKAGDTSGGLILIRNCRLLIRQKRLLETLLHELTHAGLNLLGRSRLPLWLEEGTALLMAGQKPFPERLPRSIRSTAQLSLAIRKAVRKGGFSAWKLLKPLYARARSLTVLLARQGYIKFFRFLRKVKQGTPLRRALHNHYETTPEELWSRSD